MPGKPEYKSAARPATCFPIGNIREFHKKGASLYTNLDFRA
jgi:hypothetical protein